MKILHIISDTILGGAQKVLIDLANSAVNDGNEVAVAAMSGGYLWKMLDEKVIQYQLKFMLKKINPKDIKVLGELKKIRKEFKPDIIHLHTTKPGVLGRIAFKKDKTHIVYTVHGFDVVRTVHRKFLPVEKFFQKYAGAIVPVSKYDERNLLAEGIKNNVKTIYNGIDENLIKPQKVFPIQINEEKKVLCIARISPQKDFKMFVETAREFLGQNTAFIWIGSAQNETLEQLKKEYKAPENLYLLGDIPNAANYINLCDIFVLFTNFEGLPMSIIEAMSQAKPIVASNTGGIPELVSDENGILISSKEDAVSAIKLLLGDKNKISALGKNSLQKFEKNFTLKSMWESYKKLYLSLLEK